MNDETITITEYGVTKVEVKRHSIRSTEVDSRATIVSNGSQDSSTLENGPVDSFLHNEIDELTGRGEKAGETWISSNSNLVLYKL